MWGHGEEPKLVEGALMGEREDLCCEHGEPGPVLWKGSLGSAPCGVQVMGRDGKAKDVQLPHTQSQPCPDPSGIPSRSPSWDPALRCGGERQEGCQSRKLDFAALLEAACPRSLLAHPAVPRTLLPLPPVIDHGSPRQDGSWARCPSHCPGEEQEEEEAM